MHVTLLTAAAVAAAAAATAATAASASNVAVGGGGTRPDVGLLKHNTADAASASLATAGPTVTTPDGPVVGFSQDGVDAFRGIPYAAPPTGDNRFRPPQAPSTWTAPLDATQWPPSCLQRGAPGTGNFQHNTPGWATLNVTAASEDCLYANVYAPSAAVRATTAGAGAGAGAAAAAGRGDGAKDALLPVMVYFHAGEFRFGTSNDAENAWPYFSDGNVVLVTANVRLGVLGFAALDELRSRDVDSNSTGNYGVQDQRAVLQWVKRSISAFGGDPARVTIFGESSGGSSVGFHLSSAKSAGLFQRAILESPGLTQSKTWEAASTNTRTVVSELAANQSAGCVFPATAEWQTLPGVAVGGLKALGTAKSVDAARSACAAISDCFVVGTKKSILGVTQYTYYSLAGGLLDAQFGFQNLTKSLGPSAASEVSTDIRQADMSKAEECLLKADAGTLVAIFASPPYGDTFSTDAAAPTEDGVELTQPLIHQSTQHPNKDVPVLAGANLDEGTEFMGDTPPLSCSASASDLATWCTLQFSDPTLAAAVPAAYAELQQPTPVCASSGGSGGPGLEYMRAMRAAGESAILCPSRELLKGSRAAGQSNVYWYQFVATPIYSANMGYTPVMGAFHGAEVPFVFGDQFELKSDGERDLSAAMGCYWTNFATSGNPNNGTSCTEKLKLPVWPEIGDHGDALVFGNTSIAPVSALKESRCDMFAKYM